MLLRTCTSPCIRLGASGCVWVRLAVGFRYAAQTSWDALGCIGMHWDALGCIGMHWDALGCAGMHWDALGCAGMHWDVLGWIRLQYRRYADVLGCTGLYWAARK